jgi:hypothetical protein
MSAEQPRLDPRLESWIAVVTKQWQRRGISEHDRTRLRVELERDLRLSLAEGATVDALTSVDAREFARELAEAEGLATKPLRPDHPMTTTSYIVTALLGAAAGAAASLVLIYPLGLRIMDGLTLSYTAEGVFALGLHVLAALLCTVLAMAAVRWYFRFQPDIRRITLFTGAFLLLGGAVSIGPTMALAAALGYNNTTPVVLLEVGVVVGFCVAGLGAARWLLVRGFTAVVPRGSD